MRDGEPEYGRDQSGRPAVRRTLRPRRGRGLASGSCRCPGTRRPGPVPGAAGRPESVLLVAGNAAVGFIGNSQTRRRST